MLEDKEMEAEDVYYDDEYSGGGQYAEGFHDENGDWVEGACYFEAGHYDENGEWIADEDFNYENAEFEGAELYYETSEYEDEDEEEDMGAWFNSIIGNVYEIGEVNSTNVGLVFGRLITHHYQDAMPDFEERISDTPDLDLLDMVIHAGISCEIVPIDAKSFIGEDGGLNVHIFNEYLTRVFDNIREAKSYAIEQARLNELQHQLEEDERIKLEEEEAAERYRREEEERKKKLTNKVEARNTKWVAPSLNNLRLDSTNISDRRQTPPLLTPALASKKSSDTPNSETPKATVETDKTFSPKPEVKKTVVTKPAAAKVTKPPASRPRKDSDVLASVSKTSVPRLEVARKVQRKTRIPTKGVALGSKVQTKMTTEAKPRVVGEGVGVVSSPPNGSVSPRGVPSPAAPSGRPKPPTPGMASPREQAAPKSQPQEHQQNYEEEYYEEPKKQIFIPKGPGVGRGINIAAAAASARSGLKQPTGPGARKMSFRVVPAMGPKSSAAGPKATPASVQQQNRKPEPLNTQPTSSSTPPNRPLPMPISSPSPTAPTPTVQASIPNHATNPPSILKTQNPQESKWAPSTRTAPAVRMNVPVAEEPKDSEWANRLKQRRTNSLAETGQPQEDEKVLLSHFADASGKLVHMDGFLTKISNKKSSKKWFKIIGAQLIWYDEEQPKDTSARGHPPVGIMNLRKVKKLEHNQSKKTQLSLICQDQTLLLEGKTEEDAEDWVVALTQSLKQATSGDNKKGADNTRKQGFISQKEKGSFGKWKPRFMILENGIILLKKDQNDEIISEISLYGVFIEEMSAKNDNCAQITSPKKSSNNPKDLVVRFEDADACQDWMKAMRDQQLVLESEIDSIKL